jgi:anhydro-N-acetylmuramic acid kinase
MEIYKTIGVMSGTSLDGLDVAYCIFIYEEGIWTFQIAKAVTIQYDAGWKTRLASLQIKSSIELAKTNVDFGYFIGEQINKFKDSNKIKPDFIASHGHTIFHQPNKRFTLQIGDGNAIASATRLPVIFDFRSLDVALGGQGAPLVPIGDRLLFGNFDYCINLGGFANISFEKDNKRIAFDICPVNIVLNELAHRANEIFDEGGRMARQGKINEALLSELNALEYYQLKPPKSLGREWVEEIVFPIINKYNIHNLDLLKTFTEHIAVQISNTLIENHGDSLLLTGGGAYNTYLIERLKILSGKSIYIPEPTLIEYKEALIFAFLGLLRMRNEVNCLSSVTGAICDSSCGLVVNFTK